MDGVHPTWSESLLELYRGVRERSIDQSLLPDFVRETRSKIAHFIDVGDLHHAEVYESILTNIVPLSYCVDYVSEGLSKRNELLVCIDRLRSELCAFEAVLARDLFAHDERVCAALQTVARQRARELRSFDEETEKGAPSSEYKFSGRVVEMRKVERSLIREHRFKEAATMKRERLQVEKAERIAWTRHFLERREVDRRQLEAVHDRKCEVVKDCGLNSRELIEVEGERCLNALRQRIRGLEAKAAAFEDRVLDSESVVRRKPISNAARMRAKQAMASPKRPPKSQTGRISSLEDVEREFARGPG
jgi:hypothetical protein